MSALAGEGGSCVAGGGLDPAGAAPGTIGGGGALNFLDNVVQGPGYLGPAGGNQDLLSGLASSLALAAE